MGLTSHYRALVRKNCPHACIAGDRFHVIRLINQHFFACWRYIDPAGAKHRALVWLMRRCRHKFTAEQQARLALDQAGLPQLVQLGETLYAWREEIAMMWRFTRNHGITEGLHTKMEVLQRQAYGFRNFRNYQMRVKIMSS